ncbi:MAG: hypothetical protein HY317_06215 [Acidobacteria bacterium]|nr:hypothetical protein [Acidobacteriota bacterium]
MKLPVPARRILLALALVGAAADARAGDITVFAAKGAPDETWARGYGGALSSTWFHVINLEAEAARMPGDAEDASMTAFTGSALLAPPLGILTPYGGLGFGLFRQSLGDLRDTGTLKALVLGAKLKLGGLVVIKGEYRRYDLSGEPLLPLDSRISAGAGISF